MKKKFSLILAATLAASMAACGSPSHAETSAVNSETVQQAVESTQQEQTIPETENTAAEASEEAAESSRVLIAYFSRWGNTEYPADVDATTSASIVMDGERQYGTTEYVARMIQEQTGGEIHLIETTEPYSADFQEVVDDNHEEMDQDALPELKDSALDMSAYDTVFIGYPIWATDAPRAVFSFLAEYDLSGKTVIPFCTHDGYGSGSSFDNIAAEVPDAAAVLTGFAVEASEVSVAKDMVVQWLEKIGVGRLETVRQKTAEQTDDPVLSVDVIPIGKVTSDLTVFDELSGSVDITFSLAE